MRPWFLVSNLVLFGGLYWFLEGNPADHFLTSYLSHCDRIEVELVHVNFETIDRVIAAKTLTGLEAEKLQAIWRSQDYSYASHVQCHAPAYRVRFYRGANFVTEATVCFHCHNIYFYDRPNGDVSEAPRLDATFGGLDDTNKKYLQFRDYMAGLFPGHDIETESSQRPN
jgi:hypothetical protein